MRSREISVLNERNFVKYINVIPNTAVFGPTKLIGTMTTTIASTIPPG